MRLKTPIIRTELVERAMGISADKFTEIDFVSGVRFLVILLGKPNK